MLVQKSRSIIKYAHLAAQPNLSLLFFKNHSGLPLDSNHSTMCRGKSQLSMCLYFPYGNIWVISAVLMAHDESMFIIIIFFLPVMPDLRGKFFYSDNIQKKKELSLFLFMIWALMQLLSVCLFNANSLLKAVENSEYTCYVMQFYYCNFTS